MPREKVQHFAFKECGRVGRTGRSVRSRLNFESTFHEYYFYFRGMKDFSLHLSNDGRTWIRIFHSSLDYQTMSSENKCPDKLHSYDLLKDFEAKYVKLVADSFHGSRAGISFFDLSYTGSLRVQYKFNCLCVFTRKWN